VHSELPEQEEGLMEGFQLWLNLPAKDKMRQPWYRDIQSAEIPEFRTPAGVHVRVIAGESHGIAGAVQREHTEPLYLDLTLPPGTEFAQPLPPDRNALLHVFRESLYIASSEIPTKRMAILANDPESDGVLLHAPASNHSPARALLIAGKPLREPIAQYGPFVMNTREQVTQAMQDFQSGKLG
jgi:redox-sensitive bicupin YhaK (pirin superfamily)